MPLTILCVHSDQCALMARSLMLSLAGYQVQTATSGDAAIRLFARYEFDLVIADHVLPVIDGWQLSRLMKDVKPEVQVVLLSDTLESPGTSDHTDLVLTRCMEPEQFLGAISDLVARRRPSLVPIVKRAANSN